jgi:hypothetical protein
MKKWFAGILAAVIAGVLTYYLTTGLPKVQPVQPQPQPVQPPVPQRDSVILFEHDHYKGRQVVFESGGVQGVADLKRDKAYDFGDKASSIKWKINSQCKFELYDDDHYRKIIRTLSGSGQIADLGSLGDKISSVRWKCR